MRFQYDLDRIIKALEYDDLKGLLIMIKEDIFDKQEPSISTMEKIFKELFLQLDNPTRSEIESLMLSCARYNSIGF